MAAFYILVNGNAFQNRLFRVVKRPVLRYETGRFAG